MALLSAAPATAADYVGLGDSYTSGTGTASSYADNCQRTTAAYPSLIDAALPGTGVNLSCSGARTQHITTDAQAPGNAVPQLAIAGGVNAGTDFVTLQIGGNDAGFVDTLVACAVPLSDCQGAIEEAEQTALTELPPKLNATYDAVRAAAPNATIAIVGYPRIFRPNQSCNTFFSAGEVNDLNAAADLLSDSIKALAQARDLAYIDPRQAFIGHGACDSVEWLNGLSATFENSYHPKAVGHSSGYAPLVLSGIQAIPDTEISSAPPVQSSTASPQFQFDSSPASASFQCKLDGGSFSACASPKQLGGLSEGPHTLRVRGVNAAGNVDQFPDSHTWTVDTVAPALMLDPGGPAGTVAAATAAFSFSAEAGAALSCRLDAGGFEACGSPRSYSGLADGPHAFTVRATDAAGNTSSASRSWSVDTTAPVATVNSGPGNPTASADASLEFSLDDPGAQAECRLDSSLEQDFQPCASPQQLTGLGEGGHRFDLRASDGVGNVGPVASFEWTIDTTASTVAVSSGPPPLTNEDAAELEFELDDPDSTAECSLDGSLPEPCSSPVSYSGLGDGEHTFTVRATDLAANVATDSYTWVVDAEAPPAAIDDGPPALTGDGSAELSFSSPDAGASFECRLDSSDPGQFQPCSSPRSYAGLADGAHSFELRATDAAGNTGAAATRSWTVDTTAPSATIGSGPTGAVAQGTAQFGFGSSEPGSSFECRLDSSDPGAFQPCSPPQSYPGLADGAHGFEVRATDAAGNTGAPASRSWSVDTTAPTVAFDGGPAEIVASAQADFDFHASEPGSSFQCRLDSGAPGDFFACSPPRHYAGLADGPHTLEVRATDALGNQGPPSAYAWNSDTLTPTAAIDDGPSGQVASAQASFAFSASEPGDFECRLDGQAYELCASPRSLQGLSEGPHSFELRFTDAGDRIATASRTWTVDTVAPGVAITGGPSGTVATSLASIPFTVSGGGAPQCSWDSEPFAACGSPAARSGLADGAHTLVVRSTDAAGNVGSDSREWVVDRTAPQTGIDSGPPAIAPDGVAAFSFSSDDPGASFQCSLDGSLYEPCSSPRIYSGLPAGDHSFRVRAVDPVGNLDPSPAAHHWRVAPAAGGAAGVVKVKRKCKRRGKKRGKRGRRCKRRP